MITKNSNIFEIMDAINHKLDNMNNKIDNISKTVNNIKERFGFK